jgi:hypothetical protein
MRVVNGTALYTGSRITPPTRALTNVTNTKLLCCQSTAEPGAAAVAPNVSGSINTGTQWSNYLASPNYAFMTNNPPTRAFNGLNAYGQTPPNSSTPNGRQYDGGSNNNPPSVMIFTPSGGIAYSSEVSIDYECHGPISIELNGTEVISLSGPAKTASGFSVLASGSGTITEIKLTSSGASGDYVSLYAIKVDGTVLTDPIAPNGDAAATNFNPFNTDINTVRGQESGYATLNPLIGSAGLTNVTLSNGNLTFANSDTSYRRYVPSNISMPLNTGKYYFEGVYTKSPDSNNAIYDSFGLIDTSKVGVGTFGPSNVAGTWVYRRNGYKNNQDAGNNNPGETFGDSWGVGDVIGISYDSDNGIVSGYKNGVKQGDIATDVSVEVSFLVAGYRSCIAELNFGQKPFKFPPPDGFQPLNTANTRPVNVISRPDQYVGVTTFTGNGGTQSIDVGHEPDLVWLKDRGAGEHHGLFDTIRGPLMRITSDYQYASTSRANTVTSFNYNGVTLGSAGEYNGNTDPIVCWSWKAGGSKNTFNVDDVGYASAAAAGLNSGTITPTAASVGTKQGFSIIKYTGNNTSGATLSHGLQNVPKFFVVKDLDSETGWWAAYHHSMGNTHALYLNDPQSKVDSTFWNDTSPTSSVVSFGNNANTNSTNDFIGYLWHDVPGLQKFGSYTGDATGNPFIELGFRPALLWIKNTSSSSTDWVVIDSQRQPFNQSNLTKLYISSANSESTIGVNSQMNLDFLSNGFKLRDSNNKVNASGDVYIYCAWAEAPSVDLFGGGANAR